MTKPKTKTATEAAPDTAKAVEGELHDGQMPEDNPDGISPEEATGAIVPLETIDLPALLNSGAGTDELIAKIRTVTTAIVPDMSTETGRKAVKSLAYRVSRTKSLFEEARLAHTKGLREQLDNINANGKKLVTELDKIRDEVKAPIVEWEEFETAYAEAMIEDARRDSEALEALEQFTREVQIRIDAWRGLPASFLDVDLAKAEEMLVNSRFMELMPEHFGDRLAEAQQVKDAALAKIDGLLEMQRKLARAEQDVIDAKKKADDEAQARIDKTIEIDKSLAEFRRLTMAQAAPLGSADLLTLIDGIERAVFSPAVYGDRLGDAYTARGEVVEELRELHAYTVQREADAQAAEDARAAEAKRVSDQQRRDDILSRIQGLQTTVMLAAAGRNADAIKVLRDKFATKDLDPAEWDDLLEQAAKSKAAALAKLDDLIAKERQAEQNAADAARLRQEAQEREAADKLAADAKAAADAQAASEGHRKDVRNRAQGAMCQYAGLSADDAVKAMDAIEAGHVPNVALTF